MSPQLNKNFVILGNWTAVNNMILHVIVCTTLESAAQEIGTVNQ